MMTLVSSVSDDSFLLTMLELSFMIIIYIYIIQDTWPNVIKLVTIVNDDSGVISKRRSFLIDDA
jgi:hypothetical protein